MATLFPKLETQHSNSFPMLPCSADGLPEAPPLYHRFFQARRVLERQPFDFDYVQRLAAGDAETATHFVAYFTKLLIVKLRARMTNSDLAQDVAQESLYRVLVYIKKNGGIQHPERLGAFVNSVSENVILETFRGSQRFQQVPENTPEPVAQALDAELNCITEQRKQQIRRVLGTLRAKDRLVLEKVYLLEQDKDAICLELKIDRNYLRVQVHRALRELKKALNADSMAGVLSR